MKKLLMSLSAIAILTLLTGCGGAKPVPKTEIQTVYINPTSIQVDFSNCERYNLNTTKYVEDFKKQIHKTIQFFPYSVDAKIIVELEKLWVDENGFKAGGTVKYTIYIDKNAQWDFEYDFSDYQSLTNQNESFLESLKKQNLIFLEDIKKQKNIFLLRKIK